MTRKVTLLAALAVIAVAFAAGAHAAGPSDGDAYRPSVLGGANGDASRPSVVGGANAPDGRFPYQAGVGREYQYCGGTLVQTASIPVVLTAAHCIFSSSTVKNTNVVLGGYGKWTSKKSLGGGTMYKLKSIIVHPDYAPSQHLNDIAVLILKKTPKLSAYVQAIPMATAAETTAAAGIDWLISGWGTTSQYANDVGQDGNTPGNLQYGKVNYVQPSDPICLNVTTNAPIGSAPAPDAAAKMICGYGIPSFDGGNPPRQDTCQGDSGGPLTLNVGITAGQDPVNDGDVANDRLAGVVSYGAGCGQNGLPGIYTRASAYIDWVNQQAAANAKKRSAGRKHLL